jgi:hypothetical protein
MTEYKPDLPPGVSLPPGFKVDTTDARYRALHDLASRERLSQSAFSQILGVEAQRVNADYERARATPAAPAPKAAPTPPKVDFSKLSTREQFAASLTVPSNRGNRG